MVDEWVGEDILRGCPPSWCVLKNDGTCEFCDQKATMSLERELEGEIKPGDLCLVCDKHEKVFWEIYGHLTGE